MKYKPKSKMRRFTTTTVLDASRDSSINEIVNEGDFFAMKQKNRNREKSEQFRKIQNLQIEEPLRTIPKNPIMIKKNRNINGLTLFRDLANSSFCS